MKATARIRGVVALPGVFTLALVYSIPALAASDREVALHSVLMALMLLDDARASLIERQQTPLQSAPTHAAGRVREAARMLKNRIPPASMRVSYDALKREVEHLSAAVNGLPKTDEEMAELVRCLYERQAEPGFVRASALAREAVARELADGGALGDDERLRLVTAVVAWVGERVAGVRHRTWEQLLSDYPEVTYVREGSRCRFVAPGARFEHEACDRTVTFTDSPLAQAASQLLTMFHDAVATAPR